MRTDNCAEALGLTKGKPRSLNQHAILRSLSDGINVDVHQASSGQSTRIAILRISDQALLCVRGGTGVALVEG